MKFSRSFVFQADILGFQSPFETTMMIFNLVMGDFVLGDGGKFSAANHTLPSQSQRLFFSQFDDDDF